MLPSIKRILFVVCILFRVAGLFAQVEGKSYITTNCGSGGFDYYFFPNHAVVSECLGCDARPYVQTETWKIQNGEVIVEIDSEWYGEGTGNIIAAASVSIYENYVARNGHADNIFSIPLEQFQGVAIDGCEEIGVHEYTDYSPQAFLRNGLIGKYPETSLKLLTQDDLKDKSKQELRLMRNEIYARYGYIFKSEELKSYFKKQKGYEELGTDVEAFLSEIEKANIKLIQEYEKK